MGGSRSRAQLQHSQQASVNYHVFPGQGAAPPHLSLPPLPQQVPYQMSHMGGQMQMPYQAGFPQQFGGMPYGGGGMPFQGGFPASPFGGYL